MHKEFGISIEIYIHKYTELVYKYVSTLADRICLFV